MKTSLICTVLDEEKNIGKFVDSVAKQSLLPDELIIVDGGSKDATVEIIEKKVKKYSKILLIKLYIKKGNRSVGRNEAIKKSSFDIILSSDSGCILDKDWVKTITKPLQDKTVDVVSGYYIPLYKNVFQKCLSTYTCVMPDKVDKDNFFPSSRSVAYRRNAWEIVKGYPEDLDTCEDLVFDKKMKEARLVFIFAKDAIVYWPQRKNLLEAFWQFFNYAKGDGLARYFRPQTPYLFLRYILAIYLTLIGVIFHSSYFWIFYIFLFIGYVIWSIVKNYKYVKNTKALIYLPILQFTSDFAVMLGTTIGIIQRISLGYIFKIVLSNKGVFFVLLVYIISILSVIEWGIPSLSHPFTYHMDEWHQSQSVRNLFKFGTPNIAGSANGSIFQFFLTGIYLVPFYLLGLVNVFAIKSSVTNLDLQHNLFVVLRLNTLIFGCLSILAISYIGKKYFRIHPFITALLFTINPIWIMLSNYFKYDIALVFWILISLIFLLRYAESLSLLDFILAGFFSGLSLSTKLSAIPLLPIYILTFILFTSNFRNKITYLCKGILVFLATFFLFGIPDIILGKGSLIDYLRSNLIVSPHGASNYYFGKNYFSYMISSLFPITFGHLFAVIFFISFIFLALRLVMNTRNKKTKKRLLTENKNYIIIAISFAFFFLSLIPLKLGATGNRALILLPFLTITVGLFVSRLYVKKNLIIKVFLVLSILLIIFLQGMETYVWIKLKLDPDIRVTSSNWIRENVKRGTVIGLENIPIYQKIPNILLKEFYLSQYGKSDNFVYKYRIIDFKSKNLPSVLVLTDMDVEYKYVIKSDKNNLTKRLNNEGYRKVMEFEPSLKYFYLLGNQLDFYISGLIPIPSSISIYEK